MYYFITLFGSLLYNWFLFTREKNKFDVQEKPFNVKHYLTLNWDDIGFTILCSPVLVWYMNDIVALIRYWVYKDFPQFDIYYLAVGIIVQLIYLGFDKLIQILGSLKLRK